MNDRPKPAVVYTRVSTQQQNLSGLGTEAQLHSAKEFARQHDYEVLEFFNEVESGKNCDRPELKKALAHCKLTRATLIVAKLDRLSRNVAFVSALMESAVEFICCDMPLATRLTLHIISAMAEHEAEMISQRTKAALQAAKARGQLLGAANPKHCFHPKHPRRKEIMKKVDVKVWQAGRKRQCRDYYTEIALKIAQYRAEKLPNWRIAEALNAARVPTLYNRRWTVQSVSEALLRYGPHREGCICRPCKVKRGELQEVA